MRVLLARGERSLRGLGEQAQGIKGEQMSEWTEEKRSRAESDLADDMLEPEQRVYVRAALGRIRDLEAEVSRLNSQCKSICETERKRLKAERDSFQRVGIATLERAEAAEAKLAEAQRDIAGYQRDLEEARDSGAKTMLDQMERAVTNGGKFSDERANAFVTARSVGWVPNPSAAEAQVARLRDALAALHAAVRTEKNPAMSEAAELAVAALRDEPEEPKP
jgi:hypothetical protein